MSEDTGRKPEDENPDEDETEDEDETGNETGADESKDDKDGKDGDAKKDPELEKAIRRRDRALAKVRDLEAKLAEKESKDSKPDPVKQANDRLVRAEARTQLAALGITDKRAQADVIAVLNLGDVTVDDSGEVDTDEIEDRISRLREAFGVTRKERRVPNTDTRDRGGNSKETTDPDKARYKRILSGKR